MTVVVWLRDDLRLDDQPAIAAAAADPALFVYVHDETAARPLGGASRWWLDKSLAAFGESLAAMGGRLDIVAGDAASVIPPSPATPTPSIGRAATARGRDRQAHQGRVAGLGVRCESFNGQLLREPWEVKTEAGRAVQGVHAVLAALPRDGAVRAAARRAEAAPRRAVAEEAPARRARRSRAASDQARLVGRARRRRGARARPARRRGSRVSSKEASATTPTRATGSTWRRPRGCRRICASAKSRRAGVAAAAEAATQRTAAASRVEKFLSELGWREFAHSLLYQSPDLATKNWSPRFDAFPWRKDDAAFDAWRRGRDRLSRRRRRHARALDDRLHAQPRAA